MPRYGMVWLKIAIEQLLENPHQPTGAYDKRTDQWTTTCRAHVS